MPNGKKDDEIVKDAFFIEAEAFEGPWCPCCPVCCTLPVATMVAVVIGVLFGYAMYEADVQDAFLECYSSPSGGTSTTYTIEPCVADDVDGTKCSEVSAFDVGGQQFYVKTTTSKTPPSDMSCWIELFYYPGMLWIRALKCLVSPLIACMMLLIPSKLRTLGPVGLRVAGLLLFTSFIAAMEGLVWGNVFQPGDRVSSDNVDDIAATSAGNNYVTELEAFLNIGTKAVPINIVSSMSKLDVLGIITFFLSFGYFLEYDCEPVWRAPILNSARGFLRASLNVLLMLMKFMPIAMFSLLSYNMMKTNLDAVADAVGMYLAAQLIGQFLHLVLFYFGFYFVMTRQNPFLFFWKIKNAPMTALLTSSSAATMPVTLDVNKKEREDDYGRRVVEFVVPLGAALNMDGTSLGFPIMVLFVSQVGEELPNLYPDAESMSFGNMLLVAILAMTCSLGTAPIPNAGLVYLTMLMEAADIKDEKLQGFGMAMIVLVDWIVDRVETAQNVTSDSFISAIIAKSPAFANLKALAAKAVMTPNDPESQMAQMATDDQKKTEQL